MNDRYVAVAEILMDIECELRQQHMWQKQVPPDHLLASDQPFCLDTLEFHQWLQFVFLPRMYIIVENRLDLPEACSIAPMAEEVYKQKLDRMRGLLKLLRQFDRLF